MATKTSEQNQPSCPALWITHFPPPSLDSARDRISHVDFSYYCFKINTSPLTAYATGGKELYNKVSAFISSRLLVKRVPHNSACLPDCTYLTRPFMCLWVSGSITLKTIVAACQSVSQWAVEILAIKIPLCLWFQISALRYPIGSWLDML